MEAVTRKVDFPQKTETGLPETGRGEKSITARGKWRRTGTYYNKDSYGEPNHNGVERGRRIMIK